MIVNLTITICDKGQFIDWKHFRAVAMQRQTLSFMAEQEYIIGVYEKLVCRLGYRRL